MYDHYLQLNKQLFKNQTLKRSVFILGRMYGCPHFPQNSTPLSGEQKRERVPTIRVYVCPNSSIRLFNQILNGCSIFQIPKPDSSVLYFINSRQVLTLDNQV